MKCPLFGLARNTDGDPFPGTTQDCLQEECAWWHKGRENCCIWAIETTLDVLSVLLAKIGTEMPHLEQFKRA